MKMRIKAKTRSATFMLHCRFKAEFCNPASGNEKGNVENKVGAVGTGKTHLASAIAMKVCNEGHEVKFYTAASLANILLERNNNGSMNSFMKTLEKAEMMQSSN